jgi:uncharacterized membrane protein YukC
MVFSVGALAVPRPPDAVQRLRWLAIGVIVVAVLRLGWCGYAQLNPRRT